MKNTILKIIELNYDSETGIISSPKASKEIAETFERFTDWITNLSKPKDKRWFYKNHWMTFEEMFTEWNTNIKDK